MATPSTLSALASKADQSVAKFQQDETALAAAQMAAGADGPIATADVQALISAATTTLASLPPVPPPSTTGGTA